MGRTIEIEEQIKKEQRKKTFFFFYTKRVNLVVVNKRAHKG